MQLLQLQLREFRKFSDLSLSFTAPADRHGQLILISGANEAGKSTLSDALRFALIGTSRSGAAAIKLRPKAKPQATPELGLQFSHADNTFEVRRKLGERGETTLTTLSLGVENTSHNDAAEVLLQQFFAGPKAPRKASLSGLPQALWMSQGEFEMPNLDGSADSTLRDALSTALGQMLGKAELWRQQIELELRSMEGARGPVGEYRKLLALRFELQLAHQKAQASLADFAALQARYAAITALLQADPELNSLSQQQHEIDALRGQIQGLQRQQLAHVRASAEHSSLQSQLQNQLSTLKQLESEQAALEANAQSQAELAQAQLLQNAAQADLIVQKTQAQALLHRMEQRHKIAHARSTLADWQQLDAAYQRAKDQRPRDTPERTANIAALRQHLQQLKLLEQEISARSQPAQFSVQLDLKHAGWQIERAGKLAAANVDQSQTLSLDGEALRLLHTDGSSISIAPRALNALPSTAAQQQRQTLLDSIAASASALGFPAPPEQALAMLEQDAALQAQANLIRDEAKRSTVPLLARLNLGAQIKTSAVKQGLLEAVRLLDELLSSSDEYELANKISSAQRESELSAQRSLLNQIGTELTQNIEQARYGAKRMQDLQTQASSSIVDSAATAQAHSAIAEIEAQMQAVQTQIALTQADAHSYDALQNQLDSAILRQRQSAQQHSAQNAKKQELLGQLRGVGQQELHLQEAELASQLSEASALADSQTRRFEALKHLLNLFNAEKAAFEARITEPLHSKLVPYLAALFGFGADAPINAQLQADVLTRAHGAFKPGELSLGTREQLAVLIRLAYADVLADAGYPTLLILDDVLNFSDTTRRSALMRVLENAATRHCIVLLSCNKAHWQGMQVDQAVELD